MIIFGILSIIFGFLQIIFAPISLPDFPPEIVVYLQQALDAVKGALPLIWVFFDKSVVTVCIVIVLAVINFEKIYFFIIWLLKKLKME